jgi:hypothetical protein
MATPLAFRLAVRRLTRRPVYTTAALFIFTVGTAASAFLFGVYRGLFLRPLPYPDDTRLYTIGAQFRNTPGRDGEFVVSGVDFVRYQQAATTFSVIGAHTPRDLSVVLGTLPEAVTGEAVSASLFPLLLPRMVLGRAFTEAEDRDTAAVAVISERYWRRRLVADPAVVGRAVRIDGRPVEIIGVAEAGFRTLMLDADIWVPLGIVAGREGAANRRNIAAIGRLASAGPSPRPARRSRRSRGPSRKSCRQATPSGIHISDRSGSSISPTAGRSSGCCPSVSGFFC